MRITGAEAFDFYTSWPCGEDWYLDGAMITDAGVAEEGEIPVDQLDLAGEYEAEALFGDALHWQGRGEPVMSIGNRQIRSQERCMGSDTIKVTTAFRVWRKWKKAGGLVRYVVEVPRASADNFERETAKLGATWRKA